MWEGQTYCPHLSVEAKPLWRKTSSQAEHKADVSIPEGQDSFDNSTMCNIHQPGSSSPLMLVKLEVTTVWGGHKSCHVCHCWQNTEVGISKLEIIWVRCTPENLHWWAYVCLWWSSVWYGDQCVKGLIVLSHVKGFGASLLGWNWLQRIKLSWQALTQYWESLMLQYTMAGWLKFINLKSSLCLFSIRKLEMAVEEGCLLCRMRVVVPTKLQGKLLEELHKVFLVWK